MNNNSFHDMALVLSKFNKPISVKMRKGRDFVKVWLSDEWIGLILANFPSVARLKS